MKLQERPKITALLITYNEIVHIQQVLENLAFADEIIVVDSYSTDGTVEVIKAYKNIKLVQKKFNNFTEQRNFACSLATNSWILFIDADERIPQILGDEILNTVSSSNASAAYYIKRKIFFNGKQLRFGGRQTDKIHRLFQKDKAHYRKDLLVHEKLEVTGETGILKNYLNHFPYKDFAHYEAKRKHYARLKAKELFLKKKKSNLFHFCIKPPFTFFQHYILKLGIFDGYPGLVLSYLNAKYVYKRYTYLNKFYAANSIETNYN
ncbi:MAG: glycosyl transferase [Flavobacteriaceae bacterium CG_4_8_14_3_um_filter_34_10]|nr:MAG: hypothetical protein AUK33_04295 [Flavobacteriaceae bacterium CG2_30_34_30]PIV51496.1 MAG: glycosyl transferase [Flavobacteriaceae bacterium CG02_land_8_20_14_3_00_34_13]PIX09663.1 MAG: glycosyl transferase [Flavobacteriaceae bacterium CG_4_8_14_3_um_filter_34_10]